MLHLLLACTGPIDAAPSDEGDPTEDTAPPDHVPVVNTLTVDGVHLEPVAIVTVLNVRWDTAAPTRARVTASFTDGAVIVEEATEGTTHAVQLVGLPAIAEVRVYVEALDGVIGEDEAVTTTGANPPWVPDLAWSAEDASAAEAGFTIVPAILPTGSGVVVLDGRGRAVWAWPTTDTAIMAPLTRARLSLDGKFILSNTPSGLVETAGKILRVALDGSTTEELDITEGHIDFVEYTPGGYASLGWDLREMDGRKLMGDTIVERAPDGTERVVWNVWDHFTPDLTQVYSNYYAPDEEVEDWSHINGLHYDADEDVYYVTMTYQSTIVKIDRQTGEQRWSLTDGDIGDFTNPRGEEFLDLPHSVQPVDGGVLVFNRGGFEATSAGCSYADEIALDEARWEASLAWRYGFDECLLVPYLGSAERLSGGNTLIAWTTAGQLDEVTPEGVAAWRVNTAFGAGFGFATRVPTLTP